MDMFDLSSGPFEPQLKEAIESSRVFLLILTGDTLLRCKNDVVGEDWIHKVSLDRWVCENINHFILVTI